MRERRGERERGERERERERESPAVETLAGCTALSVMRGAQWVCHGANLFPLPSHTRVQFMEL